MTLQPGSVPVQRWSWPPDVTQYDRCPDLSEAEYTELDILVRRFDAGGKSWHRRAYLRLHRLLQPLNDALDRVGASNSGKRRSNVRSTAISLLVRAMHRFHLSFWAFTQEQWLELLGTDYYAYLDYHGETANCRQHLIALSYLLGNFPDLSALGKIEYYALAKKVFGSELLEATIHSIGEELEQWGYAKRRALLYVREALPRALLANRSPRVADLTLELLETLYQSAHGLPLKQGLIMISLVLAHRAMIPQPIHWANQKREERLQNRRALQGVPTEWTQWCQHWYETSPRQHSGKISMLYRLFQAGRWLAQSHPAVTSPAQWTRELAAEYVAMVDQMTVGQWSQPGHMYADKMGKPVLASTKASTLGAMRVFFKDCQEWGWIPRTFSPERSFATPRFIRAKIGPNPRVIADESWAKLLWAGLNLTEADIPAGIYAGENRQRGLFYPTAMVQALVMVWLFCGLRRNEILRLPVGCIRWQREALAIAGTDQVLPKDAVCFLDVPVNKTSAAFTKPVDRVVGEAIAEWERVRPGQPAALDAKTGALVHFLFSYRGRCVGPSYLNTRLIPLLCRKAGVEERDARGNITSHRARSTIASQLYNAKDPMSLMELKEWLGHHSLSSTQSYAQLSPTKLAKSFSDAGYFKRNLRTIDVLIDQEAVKSGAAATGEAWKFYDLGHGYCTYDFFDQCPHRMACARCIFYCPKGSSQALLLEGKANLLRMLQEIPLSEEERAAVEDGIEAMEKLCQRLADVPTPAGPTPKQLITSEQRKKDVISLEQIRRKKGGENKAPNEPREKG